MLSQTALLGFFLWGGSAQPASSYTDCANCSVPYWWCGGAPGVGNAQTCVSSSSFCDNSACVASGPSSCPTLGATTCGTGITPTRTPTPTNKPINSGGVSATQGLGVKDAQTSFGAGLGVTFVMAALAIGALVAIVARISLPTVLAPQGTTASNEQQKAIRSWKLAVVGSACLFFSSFLGFAAPVVPWIAFSLGVNGSNEWSFFGINTGTTIGAEATVIISTATASAKVCAGSACNTLTVPNAYFIPGAALMLLGAIFQLVAAIQLAYIAIYLRRLSFTGAPAPVGCCCHNPAVQGFGWSGWVFGGIGAAWAGSAFAVVQAAVSIITNSTLTLDPAPGGVMEAFVVLVGLVGCIIAAVLNCNITGVTGVGQSTTNCCCAQEAKSEFPPSGGGLGGFGVSGVTVVMNSPLQHQQQQQQMMGAITNAWPPPPSEQHPVPHWITPAPPQQFMYSGSGTPSGYPMPTATYSLPPPQQELELAQQQQQQQQQQQEKEQPETTTATTITLV